MSRNLGATISELFKSNPALAAETAFASTETLTVPQFRNAAGGRKNLIPLADRHDLVTNWVDSGAGCVVELVDSVTGPFGETLTVTKVTIPQAAPTAKRMYNMTIAAANLVNKILFSSFWVYGLTDVPVGITVNCTKGNPFATGSASPHALVTGEWCKVHTILATNNSVTSTKIQPAIGGNNQVQGDIVMYVCHAALYDVTEALVPVAAVTPIVISGTETLINFDSTIDLPRYFIGALRNQDNTPTLDLHGVNALACRRISDNQISMPITTTVAGTVGDLLYSKLGLNDCLRNIGSEDLPADIYLADANMHYISIADSIFSAELTNAGNSQSAAIQAAIWGQGSPRKNALLGFGGSTMAQQLTLVQALSAEVKQGGFAFISCGALEEVSADPQTGVAAVQAVIDELENNGNQGNWLVLGCHLQTPFSVNDPTTAINIIATNEAMAVAFGAKFYSPYDYLVSQSAEPFKSANSIEDPKFIVSPETLHLSTEGKMELCRGAIAHIEANIDAWPYMAKPTLIQKPISHTLRPLDVTTQPIANFNEAAFTFVYRLSMSVAQAALTQSNGIISIDGNAASLLYIDAAGIKTNHGAQLINPALAANEIVTIAVRGGTTSGNIQLGVMQAGVWTWAVAAAYVAPVLDAVISIGSGMQAGNTYDIEIREVFAEEKSVAWIEVNY